MSWYMTVGYPGGEWATKAPNIAAAYQALGNGKDGAPYLTNTGLGFQGREIEARPCPPDVVEWIEAEGEREYTLRQNESYQGTREKVPGGWLYREWENEFAAPDDPREARGLAWYCTTATFVPVPGTQNLTILEADNDTQA